MWQAGRQGTGYYKWKLFEISWPVKADLYLLKYPEGSWVPVHKDPVESGKHFRVNLLLNKVAGGRFSTGYGGRVYLKRRRLVVFRPDLTFHWVLKVIRGTRYVLSLGFVL